LSFPTGEKAKEEIRRDIKLYKQNQKDVMTVVDEIEELLKPGQRDSRKTGNVHKTMQYSLICK